MKAKIYAIEKKIKCFLVWIASLIVYRRHRSDQLQVIVQKSFGILIFSIMIIRLLGVLIVINQVACPLFHVPPPLSCFRVKNFALHFTASSNNVNEKQKKNLP